MIMHNPIQTQRIEKESLIVDNLFEKIHTTVIGQKPLVEKIMIALLCDGHILLEGLPGLAKTLSIRSFAAAVHGQFQRIQFTPDLLPADIVGTLIFNQQTHSFTPKKGPIFTNFLLADEINRAPAKVQSALLEGMQERQVTIGETTFPLPGPFFVLATQNPIEQEGTYPLPEAQMDRFMLKVLVDYPLRDEEFQIMDRVAVDALPMPSPVIALSDIERLKTLVYDIYADDKIKHYILNIIEATRHPEKYNLKKIAHYIKYGASPRASINMLKAAKAHAFIQHRGFVSPEDVKAIGPDVLRHRILLSFEAEADEKTTDEIISILFNSIEVP